MRVSNGLWLDQVSLSLASGIGHERVELSSTQAPARTGPSSISNGISVRLSAVVSSLERGWLDWTLESVVSSRWPIEATRESRVGLAQRAGSQTGIASFRPTLREVLRPARVLLDTATHTKMNVIMITFS